MRCYNHHDRDAFGTCLACGKALCLECMDTSNSVISCKTPTCKEKARLLNKAYGQINYTTSRRNRVLTALIGWIFVIVGGALGISAVISQDVLGTLLYLVILLFGTNMVSFSRRS